MTFSLLSIADIGLESSYLTPAPGAEPNTVELEDGDGDGDDVETVTAKALTVRAVSASGSRLEEIAGVRNVAACLLISDSRVAVACSKYQKGGGWGGWGAGGMAVALVANGVSRARASWQRQGKMLVGHVRYPWLVSVGFRESNGLFGNKCLRLGMTVPVGQKNSEDLVLDVGLPNNLSAQVVAQEVVRRAAEFRLGRHGLVKGLSPQEQTGQRELAQELVDAPLLDPVSGQFASYFLVDPPEALASAFGTSGTVGTRS